MNSENTHSIPTLSIYGYRKLIREQCAEIDRLRTELNDAKQETARLVKKLHREQDYAAYLENRHIEEINHE